MAHYRSIRDLDWPLLVITLLICAMGVLQIYSATRGTKYDDAWWKQALWVLGGLLVMWIVAQIDYHTLLGQAYVLYFLSIASLVLVLFIGTKVFGGRRWIGYGSFHLQISEFVKTGIIFLVARYMTELKTDRVEGRDLLRLGG
jgi:rod shape determining protein RodA